MRHVYWVIPGLLAGRPGPDAVEWVLAELCKAGFGAVLSLHDSGIFLSDVVEHRLGHLLVKLPNPDPMNPSAGILFEQQVPRALGFIRRQLVRGIPTLVHCHAGRDRTGIVLTCYLSLYRGMSSRQAIALLRAVKPSILSTSGYEALAHRLVARFAQ